MNNFIDINNIYLKQRYNMFLVKEKALNKRLLYFLNDDKDLNIQYQSLLRLSYLLGEPFDGKFGFRNIINSLI